VRGAGNLSIGRYFDIIQALIEQKQETHPLLSKIWKDLVEHLGPLDIRANILAYYHTDFGSYTNLVVLTARLIIDLEANESSLRQGLFIYDLNSVRGIVTTDLVDRLVEPISDVAVGETKNPTMVGNLVATGGERLMSWYATEEEEDELRRFLREVSVARFS